ncbi:sugar kinase [Herbiconiux sp. KACC 21604]|uniref:sugar kinase n=1 Tax=unclassified Herbiconiux TaxID=2618217 RepID=UPI001491ACB6|nr:sugar kinase [Herbiconiux sp. SALV-R1]QJU55279.1 sugar kinase [Herbiconiux sp. SALV-R1]WPO86446.1 sugar kinase [Herbiconiux sp. KACC 21604]
MTIGETLGYVATQQGEPLSTARTLRFGLAGAEATVAIGAARLGHGATYVGCVGNDSMGRRILRDLRGEGVDTSYVRIVDDRATAMMVRDHRSSGRTDVTYLRAGNAGSALATSDVVKAFAAEPADIVHVSGITLGLGEGSRHAVHAAIEKARALHVLVSFDVNLRRTLPYGNGLKSAILRAASSSDIVFIGDDELADISPASSVDLVRRLLSQGASEVVVKRGADGASVFDSTGAAAHVEAEPVVVVDVIGAGDSFVAGYLTARAEGASPRERLARGTQCAALTVGGLGDWESLPYRHQLGLTAGVAR